MALVASAALRAQFWRLNNVSSMNLLFDNHCVSSSPSKIEGVGGSMIVSRYYNFAIIIPLSHFVTAPLSKGSS